MTTGPLTPELLYRMDAPWRAANYLSVGGNLLRDLRLPDFRSSALQVPSPGVVEAEDTRVLGQYLLDVTGLNQAPRTFRLFGPDETVSNRLSAVFEVTDRQWDARTVAKYGRDLPEIRNWTWNVGQSKAE